MSDFSKPVLAFESSLGGCVVAVVTGDSAFVRAVETQREQSAILMPLVQEAMRESGAGFSDLGLIVTTIGPGSFTGLRISLSAARAMALSLDIPLQGVTTLEAMAYTAVPEEKDCAVVLETKRTDYYVQMFNAQKNPAGAARCMEEDELRKEVANGDYILCGDALTRLGMDGYNCKLLDSAILARLGLRHFLKCGQRPEKLDPLYLRGADVSMSNKTQRIINNATIS